LEKSLLKIDWKDIQSYSDEDISYFLFLEGKNIEAVSRIRNLSRETVETHIISGKIKFGMLARSKDTRELFRRICSAGKMDKLNTLTSLDEENRKGLFNYISSFYVRMNNKEKEVALWIIGECKEKMMAPILKSAVISDQINLRRLAVSAIGKIRDPLFEDTLISCLNDPNPQVVLYALKALAKIKSKKSIDKVKLISEESDKDYLIRACIELVNEVNS
jgi:HEAT repeat protein